MKRRKFLQTSIAAAGAGALTSVVSADDTAAGADSTREFYELRRYQLRKGPKQKLFDDFYRDAAIPAMRRAGIGPVGVFNVMYGPDSPSVYVLLAHKSIESFATADERVQADPEYQKAGAEFTNVPATDPSYIRVESFLLRAFAGMPKLEVPAGAAKNQPRVFELRTYESHSKKANVKKIEMFNQGEIAIFRRSGLQPVFFGETIVGSKMPSLTYLLVYENMAAHDKAWGTFVRDPEWKKMSSTPGYTDPEIVTNISNIFLSPAAYSQI